MPADGRHFFDTNVLIYLLSPHVAKSRLLDQFMLEGGTVSVQVLNEFVNVGRKKFRLGVAEILPFLSTLRMAFEIRPLTAATHDTGVRIIARYGLSTYDAMIVAAALEAGCERIFSEDMQDGMRIDDRLTIQNPFRTY